MKKLISVVLCLLLIVPCACAEEQPRRLTEDDPAYTWLYEKSLETAGSFQKSLNSPFHSFLFFSSQAEKDELKEEPSGEPEIKTEEAPEKEKKAEQKQGRIGVTYL